MRLELTEEQEELRRAVRDFCAREVDAERLLAWEKDPRGLDDRIRDAVGELGWLGLGLPASRGGSGASLVDTASLVQECARGLLARPLIGALRSALAVADLDPESPLLPDLATGKRTVTLALDERLGRAPGVIQTRVTATSGPTVSGEKTYVPDADSADLHLVSARDGSGMSAVLVERAAPGVKIDSLKTFGNDRQANVTYAQAPVTARVVGPADGEAALARAWRRQVALGLAEMVGGMDAVLAMTVAYVKEREQFGQKIALFQAVRHQIADMGTRFTAARHLAWQAITRVAAGTEQGTELASATAYVGQSFKLLCWAAHHLHGGAGFVVEHPLRFHSERAQSLCIRYTPEGPALAEVATALLG